MIAHVIEGLGCPGHVPDPSAKSIEQNRPAELADARLRGQVREPTGPLEGPFEGRFEGRFEG